MKVMGSHGDTSQFGFSDKDIMSEIEKEDSVVKLPRPVSLGGTARTTELKFSSFSFLRKELCRQRNHVILWTLS
jgi:hypothetical protein